jgi:ABC-type phosphate transport system ATPase subunit
MKRSDNIMYRDERLKPLSQREIELQERFNSARLNAERIARISDNCHIQTNSCNLFIGPSGCGKSASMFVELIEMPTNNPNIHCVIYVVVFLMLFF